MNSTTPLTGAHLRTYKTIFQHPISHNLEWRAVYALLGNIGELSEEPNGNLKFMRNGQSLVLHPSRTKDVAEMEEMMALRHFLERSETTSSETDEAGETGETGEKETHYLVVIDHRQARIFRSLRRGAVLQQVLPHAPEDYFRHAHNSKEVSRGKEKPDPNDFFDAVAKALQDASHLLIFGTGTGTSNEMDQFVAWLKLRQPKLAARIIGSLVVDEHHLTEGQLLAKAREFYASTPAS